MARGRFVSKAIIRDRGINDLSCDTSRLAFTWLITIADCEGRTVGEPDLLKSALFPRRSDITPDQIETYINEWVSAGFIIWYYGKDEDRYIQFVNFDKHQIGLRKGREAESEIDAPELCRSVDGAAPEEIGLRLRLRSRDNNTGDEKETLVKNPGALRALEKYYANKDNPDVSQFPEHTKDLAIAFIEESGINPTKKEKSYWIGSLINLYDINARPDDVRRVVLEMRRNGLTIKSPESVFSIVRDKIAKNSGKDGERWNE